VSGLSDATSGTNDASPAGTIYQAMVGNLLAAEYERRAKMEARGSTLVTASASLLTLVFGLTVVVTGKDYVFTNGFAVLTLIAALIAFVVSAVLGIVVHALPVPYNTVGRASLDQLTDDSFWQLSADEALRNDVWQQGDTIRTLRIGNERKAKWVTASLVAQVMAILLLTVSVGIELVGRTSLLTGILDWVDGYYHCDLNSLRSGPPVNNCGPSSCV
jgi:hypothetical protein